MKIKEYTVPLSDEDHLNIKLKIEEGRVVEFVLNLTCKIEGEWHEVYRVDTAHGYLHEQRFWLSPKPIRLPQDRPLEYAYELYLNKIRENFKRYRRYYNEKIKSKR